MGVGDVRVARVQLDETVEGVDRVVVAVVLIVGVGRHDLGLGGPGGIGVLALDLVEQARGIAQLAGLHGVHGVVVEGLDRLLDVLRLVRVEQPAGPQREAQPSHRQGPSGAPEAAAGFACCSQSPQFSAPPRPDYD